ncbi:MAG: Trk system potassium transporter TrkA [Candidatus Cryptobacteroides sp.]
MNIIIEGAGEVGSHLAKMLSAADNDITVIDNSEARLAKLTASADIVAISGNPSSIRTLREAGVDHADMFIAVNPGSNQDINIVSAILAKRIGCKKVCARVDNEEYISYDNKYMFTEMGIDLLFYPEKVAAAEIVSLLKHSSSTESMDFARGKLQMGVFRLEEDSPIIDMTVAEFATAFAQKNHNFRIVAVSRDETTMIPRHDTRFRYHDVVFIIIKRESLEPLMNYLGKSSVEVNNVMILGAGQIGEMVAKGISRSVDDVKVIDSDRELCLELSEKTDDNVICIHGDGRNPDFLLEENIREADAFVAVTGNDEANVLACVVAKKFGVARTIAEVENIEYIKLAEEMGVDAVINKKLITAGKIYKMTLSNKVRFVKYMSGTNAEVLEYNVAPDSLITRKPLKDMAFPENAIIGGVVRGSESFIAVGDTMIEAYDRVSVFAMPDAVKEVDKLFNSR